MSKLIKFFLALFCLTILSLGVAGKAIPPGTGEADIKNNILFMLDYSNEMNKCSGLSCADNRPHDVVVGYNGDIYVVGGYGGNIFRYNSAGTYQNKIKVATSAIRMYGCGMDPTDSTDKYIYCADWAYSWIAKICTGRVLDSDCSKAGVVKIKKYVSSPLDMAVHSSGDWLISADCSGVRRYNLPNLTTTSTKASTGCPDFVTFDDSGNWYVTIWYQNNTQKWSGTSSFSKQWTNTNCRQSEMTAYSEGYLFVTERGKGKVCKMNPTNGNIVIRYGKGEGKGPLKFKNAWGGAPDPTTGNIYIADTDNRRIQEITTDGEFVKTFETGEKTKLQVALAAIKTIINDAEINESAQFGLLVFNTSIKPRIFAPINDKGKSILAKYMEKNLNNPKGSLSSHLGCNVSKNYWRGNYSSWVFNKSGSPTWEKKSLDTPVQANTTACQNNFNVLMLGSGTSNKITQAQTPVANLLSGPENVKTFVVAIGSSTEQSTKVHDLAVAGGTGPAEIPPNPQKPGVMFASDADSLVQKLREALRSSIAAKLTFASPSIDLDYSQGTEKTYVVQATFDYKESSPWVGQLSKYEIQSGIVSQTPLWKAHEQLNNTLPTARKIFTIEDTGGSLEIPREDSDKIDQYSDGTPKFLNNFHPDNASLLVDFMCVSSLCDERDIRNLINYQRGWDAYDENQNCTESLATITNSPLAYNTETDSCIKESRGTFINTVTKVNSYKLFDIYHSKPVIIEPPSDPAFAYAEHSETKYRFIKGYNTFKEFHKNRDKIVLVGSNGGMVHAFNYGSGIEEWAFVPPSLLNKFETTLSARKTTNLDEPDIINESNTTLTVLDASQFPSSGVVRIDDEYMYYTSKTNTELTVGTRGFNGSTAAKHMKDAVVMDVSSKQSVASSMYGVDGTAVVKDIFTLDDGCSVPTWKSVAVIPLGRGGHSYTALDITDVKKPMHLFTIENDTSSSFKKAVLWHTVYTRTNCLITSTRTYKKTTTYEIPSVTPLATLTADITATDTTITVDDASGYKNTNCPQTCVIQIDSEIMNYESISGNTFIDVSRQQAADSENPNSTNEAHDLGATVFQAASCGIDNTVDFSAAKETLRYDYSALAQAWGKPDINLLDLEDGSRRWVAIIGAGYNGASDCNNGSAIYLIHLENFTSLAGSDYYYGSIAKKINIPGGDLDIPNSIPGDLTVITNDSSTQVNMGVGALVYFADINNRVWKVNLLKSAAAAGALGEKKLLYSDPATFEKDNRNFQRVLATIDESVLFDGYSRNGLLRLYYGTGNVQNMGEANITIQNAIYGLSDPEFPKYGSLGTSLPADSIDDSSVPLYSIANCFNGTLNAYSGGSPPNYDCPNLTSLQPGWKIDLEQGERVVGEKALLTGGYTYFSIYQPSIQNACTPGDASMGVYDYMCPAGASVQVKLGKGLLTAAESDGEYIYFGQSNVSDPEGDRGTVKTGTALGIMADAGKGDALATSVQSIDEGGTGSLGRMGVAEKSQSESMSRSWRELR